MRGPLFSASKRLAGRHVLGQRGGMETCFHDFLHDLRAADLPDEVRALGRQWALDLIGVAAGGLGTRLSRIIRDHAATQFGAGPVAARMLFDGRRVSPAGAALAGGMTIDALDAHDGHKLTKGHAGCGVFPALLALLEAEGRLDGDAVLSGLVLGYEIGTRAGIALHRSVADYHTSGAWIAVAVAALGARILQLSPEATRHAIGIAEYHGPRSQMMRCIDHPTMVKDGSGWGAMAGVSSAYLARAGFTGAPAVTVEGAEHHDLWGDLGRTWRITEQYFKAFPICRWAQPPVQAALDLKSAHSVGHGEIARVKITTFHQSRRLATRAPRTTEEAQYSTAFPVAVALVRGRVGPEDICDAALADPEIRRLAEAIEMEESAEFNAAFPARRIARVTLFMRDGRVLESGPVEARGDPETPVGHAEVAQKYWSYATPVLGEGRASAIAAQVVDLGEGGDATRLLDLVTAPVV